MYTERVLETRYQLIVILYVLYLKKKSSTFHTLSGDVVEWLPNTEKATSIIRTAAVESLSL